MAVAPKRVEAAAAEHGISGAVEGVPYESLIDGAIAEVMSAVRWAPSIASVTGGSEPEPIQYVVPDYSHRDALVRRRVKAPDGGPATTEYRRGVWDLAFMRDIASSVVLSRDKIGLTVGAGCLQARTAARAWLVRYTSDLLVHPWSAHPGPQRVYVATVAREMFQLFYRLVRDGLVRLTDDEKGPATGREGAVSVKVDSPLPELDERPVPGLVRSETAMNLLWVGQSRCYLSDTGPPWLVENALELAGTTLRRPHSRAWVPSYDDGSYRVRLSCMDMRDEEAFHILRTERGNSVAAYGTDLFGVDETHLIIDEQRVDLECADNGGCVYIAGQSAASWYDCALGGTDMLAPEHLRKVEIISAGGGIAPRRAQVDRLRRLAREGYSRGEMALARSMGMTVGEVKGCVIVSGASVAPAGDPSGPLRLFSTKDGGSSLFPETLRDGEVLGLRVLDRCHPLARVALTDSWLGFEDGVIATTDEPSEAALVSSLRGDITGRQREAAVRQQ